MAVASATERRALREIDRERAQRRKGGDARQVQAWADQTSWNFPAAITWVRIQMAKHGLNHDAWPSHGPAARGNEDGCDAVR